MGDQPASKRSRRDWTLADKIWLLDYRDKNKNQKPGAVSLGLALADHLNKSRSADQKPIEPPSKSTVNDWIRDAAKLREHSVTAATQQQQRARAASHPRMEEALAIWFQQQEVRGLVVTNELLRGQARTFAPNFNVSDDFAFSDGWLQGFKQRHGISRVVLHGEASSADQEGVQLARENMKRIIAGYSLDDVYNQDETGNFWRQLPQRTLATGKKSGRKKDKTRATVSLTCNATGTDKR
jgi:Tc5 transposase DNA-binding domain